MNNRATVLLVDDEKRIQRAWRRALKDEPYTMIFADSGKEALEVLSKVKTDLVVTDYAMANGDGLFLLGAIRNNMPEIKTILVSGNATLDVAQEAINELGVSKLFQKPCSALDLGLAIRELLDKSAENLKPQSSEILNLEREHPGISKVKKDASGVIIVD